MTTTLDIDPVKETELIAGQNDAFRRPILRTTPVADAPQGQFVMTRGVAALGPDAQLALTRRVASFDAFNADSDPHGWHEMGVIDFDGTEIGEPDEDNPVTAEVSAVNGEVVEHVLEYLNEHRLWRLVMEVRADTGAVAELKAYLVQDDRRLSETWLYQWKKI